MGSRREVKGWLTASQYLIIAGCWLLFGLFNASRLRVVVPDITWEFALLYGLPDGLLWAALTPIPVALARRFPLPAPRTWRNMAIHLVAGVVVAVAHTQIDALLGSLREIFVTGEWIFGHLARKLLVNAFHLNFLIYMLIAGIAMYFGRLRSLRAGERRAARLHNQLIEARLAALRAQTRPHFLFNTLHTVGALIERDAVTGRRILRQLGELLRASLATDGEREIPLAREIELTRAYLGIEQARLGDRLSVVIDVEDDALDSRIPALLLQPLVENSIRHGIARLTGPGSVTITGRRHGDRLVVRIRDSGPGDTGASPGTGIGLASVRERLRAHYGDSDGDGDNFDLEIERTAGFTVTLSIPHRPAGANADADAESSPERRAS